MWRLDALLILLLAWSSECFNEKEDAEVYKDDLPNSFCGWFSKENAKKIFSERRFFKKSIKTGGGKMLPLVFFQ